MFPLLLCVIFVSLAVYGNVPNNGGSPNNIAANAQASYNDGDYGDLRVKGNGNGNGRSNKHRRAHKKHRQNGLNGGNGGYDGGGGYGGMNPYNGNAPSAYGNHMANAYSASGFNPNPYGGGNGANAYGSPMRNAYGTAAPNAYADQYGGNSGMQLYGNNNNDGRAYGSDGGNRGPMANANGGFNYGNGPQYGRPQHQNNGCGGGGGANAAYSIQQNPYAQMPPQALGSGYGGQPAFGYGNNGNGPYGGAMFGNSTGYGMNNGSPGFGNAQNYTALPLTIPDAQFEAATHDFIANCMQTRMRIDALLRKVDAAAKAGGDGMSVRVADLADANNVPSMPDGAQSPEKYLQQALTPAINAQTQSAAVGALAKQLYDAASGLLGPLRYNLLAIADKGPNIHANKRAELTAHIERSGGELASSRYRLEALLAKIFGPKVFSQ